MKGGNNLYEPLEATGISIANPKNADIKNRNVNHNHESGRVPCQVFILLAIQANNGCEVRTTCLVSNGWIEIDNLMNPTS